MAWNNPVCKLCGRKKVCVLVRAFKKGSNCETDKDRKEWITDQNANNEAVSVIPALSARQEAFVVSKL